MQACIAMSFFLGTAFLEARWRVVQCLSSKHKALSSNSSATKKKKKRKTRRTAFCYPIDSVKWNFDIYLIA
jgi:hypothetical protein